MAMGGVVVRAESGTIPDPPAGVVEAGTPSFIVLGADSLGFSTAPSDLHILPDGRILIASQREIAIGDGVRWETFQQAADEAGFIYGQVAVDGDGKIYAGINRSIARIDLGEDSHWRFVPVIPVPYDDPYGHVVQFSDTWLWFSGGGAVISWRPGKPLRTSGLSAAVEQIFGVGKDRFASNQSSGALDKLHFGGDSTVVSRPGALAADTVTSSAEYGPNEVLLGTAGDGLHLFDGKDFKSMTLPRILGPGTHIEDVCRVGNDFFAAAVETTGIVFFNRGGSIVQVLSRTLDQRLGRIHRLVYSPNGVLWALLDNAVACVQFPSQISKFDPLLSSAVSYARPVRHEGDLWILADGRLLRGIFSPDGVLERFDGELVPGRFVWAVSEVRGKFFAATERGLYVRDGIGWHEVAAGIVNARVGIGKPDPDGRVFYVAQNEVGWLDESAGRYEVERIPVKGLGEVYNAVTDSSGVIWLELGPSRVGRIELAGGVPKVRIFGKEDGLGDGWTSVFLIDGVVRFTTSLHLQRLDPRTQLIVADEEMIRRVPDLLNCTGRPARDPSGRLWFACQGTLHYADDLRPGASLAGGTLPLGFEPTEFYMEPDGVIWMQARGHLVRYDPRMPKPPGDIPVKALITSVQLTASDRRLYTPGPELPPLRYPNNSLVVRFVAASNLFGPPVTFEVMIGGATDKWLSTGTVGSASFNRLKEGRYVFHVRPVVNGVLGEEARLAFAVEPPWYRTELAWAIYIVVALTLVLSGAWFFSYLEGRETLRLGRLVAERTAALAASEERYRRLNAQLETRVVERTTELSKANADLKREIAERSRAEERIQRLNRTLAVRSDINQAIVRERDLLALYRETCRIAVERGGFRLAWIGLLDSGSARVIPVIHAGGPGDFVERLAVDLDDITPAAGPDGQASSHGYHAICNDIEHDPRMKPWRDAALHLGYLSTGAFLLRVSGRTMGAISLYSADPGFFDDEEIRLLDELAMDLSFAIEHAEAESGRRQAEERLRQAQKMEAIGQLAGGVAHDFNNLLTVIQGHCGLLLTGSGAADREMVESATEIQSAATRAANLTRQLLTFSRRQPMKLRPVELDDVVSGVSRMLQRLIGEDIVLHTRLLPGGAWVEGDPGMIEQVLLNLAVNARDAMPGGGQLWLGIDAATIDEVAARRHPAARPGSFICLSLRDAGLGIAADNLPHIFEPFFTTKEVGKGTGLGLATVHGIVEQHRGWIEVESEPGKGSTFRVYLPQLSQAAGLPAALRDPLRTPGGNESILVAEDEDAVRVLVVKILGAQGYRVQAAPSGAAALELWRQQPGAFDLLLTDLIMPGGISGMQLAEQLRAEQPDLRVIYMSGYQGSTTGGREPANFLQKPFAPSVLAAAVRSCLDTGQVQAHWAPEQPGSLR